MMDTEFIKWFATLGIGGVLAGFMFMFYRKDVKMYTELWKIATDQLILIVKENTAAQVKLVSLIESQERNMFRKTDILSIVDQRVHTIEPRAPGVESMVHGEAQRERK